MQPPLRCEGIWSLLGGPQPRDAVWARPAHHPGGPPGRDVACGVRPNTFRASGTANSDCWLVGCRCKQYIINAEIPLRIQAYEEYVAFSLENTGKILFKMEKSESLSASTLALRLSSRR